MTIEALNTGRRYNREWIFRNLNYTFESGEMYALTGSNGSGKSTLLKVLSGMVLPSEGEIKFIIQGALITESLYANISIAGPYLQLYEDMTLDEALRFHNALKPLTTGNNSQEFCKKTGLKALGSKHIRSFSSGMKQRVKLGFAMLSSTPLLLLDEPCSNLDDAGINTYNALLVEALKQKRTIIIASNSDKNEIPDSAIVLKMEDYK